MRRRTSLESLLSKRLISNHPACSTGTLRNGKIWSRHDIDGRPWEVHWDFEPMQMSNFTENYSHHCFSLIPIIQPCNPSWFWPSFCLKPTFYNSVRHELLPEYHGSVPPCLYLQQLIAKVQHWGEFQDVCIFPFLTKQYISLSVTALQLPA